MRHKIRQYGAKNKNINVTVTSENEFDDFLLNENHQGIIAQAASLPNTEKDLRQILTNPKKRILLLILDGVTDPHNLGACLRSADAASVDAVILPKDNSARVNQTVCKVASGATESVPVITVTNLARTLTLLQSENIWLYGAAEEASKNLWEIDFKRNVAIVMGAEEKGLRRLTKQYCDELFAIPMQGHVASLNVSVAAGVSLFEVVRQRTQVV